VWKIVSDQLLGNIACRLHLIRQGPYPFPSRHLPPHCSRSSHRQTEGCGILHSSGSGLKAFIRQTGTHRCVDDIDNTHYPVGSACHPCHQRPRNFSLAFALIAVDCTQQRPKNGMNQKLQPHWLQFAGRTAPAGIRATCLFSASTYCGHYQSWRFVSYFINIPQNMFEITASRCYSETNQEESVQPRRSGFIPPYLWRQLTARIAVSGPY